MMRLIVRCLVSPFAANIFGRSRIDQNSVGSDVRDFCRPSRGRRWPRTLASLSAQFGLALFLVVAILGAGPRSASGQLADDVLKLVKRGTVHLHVKQANGTTAEGSGWFVDRGMIITNAHVLNMHGGDKRVPLKIEVTIDSGEQASRSVTAKYKGAAFESDLTV